MMKDNIAEAVFELSQKMSIDKISVTKIVERTGISRALFYYYFQDVFDVLVYIFKQHLDEALDKALFYSEFERSVTVFLDTLFEYKSEISNCLNSKYRSETEREIMFIVQRYVKKVLKKFISYDNLTIKELDYKTLFISYILIGYIVDNLAKSAQNHDDFARYLSQFFL